MALPPKFACFEKLDPVKNQAELQKTFNTIRWKKRNSEDESAATEVEMDVYDEENKLFDFRNLKATSLPFNQRVCIPPLADESTESKIAFARDQITDVLKTMNKQEACQMLTVVSKMVSEAYNNERKLERQCATRLISQAKCQLILFQTT